MAYRLPRPVPPFAPLASRLLSFVAFLCLAFTFAALPLQAQDNGTDNGTAAPSDDPYRWLEQVNGEQAMRWVNAQNTQTLDTLRSLPGFGVTFENVLRVLNSSNRLATPTLRGDYVYNFWTSDDSPRGVWRRASFESYVAGSPDWTVLIDVDALADTEGVDWAFEGAACLPPAYRRCLVRLSRNGADAVSIQEFDTRTGSFVRDGFRVSRGPATAAWVDRDTLLVATDWGEGSLTTTGEPRSVRRWVRGTPLRDARPIYRARAGDEGVRVDAFGAGKTPLPVIVHDRAPDDRAYYAFPRSIPSRLPIPADAEPVLSGDHLAVYLNSDWRVQGRTFREGSVLAAEYRPLMRSEAWWTPVFEPGPGRTVRGRAGVRATESTLLISSLDSVRTRLHRFRYDGSGWVGEQLDVPDYGDLDVVTTSATDDRFFFTFSGFLQPSTLTLGTAQGPLQTVDRLPSLFSKDGLTVRQHVTTSSDGTDIPYFVVRREDAPTDGTTPTVLFGYGGFEVSALPSYLPVVGSAWLEHGGAYAVATIRGGGEFGEAWHRAARRENRQRAYDDFIAVAEALVESGLTRPGRLGIQGGANGGLLVGVAMTQRPDLFGAAAASVPVFDMQRYDDLLADAAWIDELGDPDDPRDWAFLADYSPYHNLSPGVHYPRPLFTTVTHGAGIHPAHGRKMAARMQAMGHPVYYYEDTEGVAGAAITPEQQARTWALTYAYFWNELGAGSATTADSDLE